MAMTLAGPSSGWHKAIKLTATLTGAYVGISTAVNLIVSKTSSVSSMPFFPNKVQYVVSAIVGQGAATALFQGQRFALQTGPAPVINPLGPLNSSTFAGVVLLVIDWAVHMAVGGKYGYSYASPFVKAIGGGLLGGGIIGGIFDPPAGGSAGYSTGSRSGAASGFAFANAGAGRSAMGFTGAI